MMARRRQKGRAVSVAPLLTSQKGLTGLTIIVANFPMLGPRQEEAAVAPATVSMLCLVEDGLKGRASNRTDRQGQR